MVWTKKLAEPRIVLSLSQATIDPRTDEVDVIYEHDCDSRLVHHVALLLFV